MHRIIEKSFTSRSPCQSWSVSFSKSPGRAPPGVVDEDIHAAQGLGRPGDEVANLLRNGDVGDLGEDGPARPAELLGCRSQLVPVPGADRHVHAERDEFSRDGIPQAPGAPGDDGGAPLEAEVHPRYSSEPGGSGDPSPDPIASSSTRRGGEKMSIS